MEKILKWKNENVCKINILDDGYLLDVSEIYDYELLPLGVEISDNKVNANWIRNWWKNNAIPTERDSIKRGLSCIGVESEEELKLLGRGLSLTNHYWLCDPGENILWEDINFWDNGFSEDIGNALFNHKPIHDNTLLNFYSPDSSLNGMLKKAWVMYQDKFYLAKSGSGYLKQEVFNEIIANDLFESANINHANYRLGKYYGELCCYSLCITDKNTELVHASQLFNSIPRLPYPNEENELEYFFRIMDHYNIDYDKTQLDSILAIDYILSNTDRHYNNLGFLVSREHGTRKLSPVFDNGTSLWCSTQTKDIIPTDDSIIARPFCDKTTYGNWEKQIEYINDYPHIKTKDLKEAILNYGKNMAIHSEIPHDRILVLTTGILERSIKLQEYIINKGKNINNDYIVKKEDINEIKEKISNYFSQKSPKKDMIMEI